MTFKQVFKVPVLSFYCTINGDLFDSIKLSFNFKRGDLFLSVVKSNIQYIKFWGYNLQNVAFNIYATKYDC